jgi:hypothetical protein
MQRGLPSVNPHGRPPVGRSLASAIRRSVPPQVIVSLALRIVENEEATPPTRLRALELLAARGYGTIAALGQHLPPAQTEPGGAPSSAAIRVDRGAA